MPDKPMEWTEDNSIRITQGYYVRLTHSCSRDFTFEYYVRDAMKLRQITRTNMAAIATSGRLA